MTNKEYSGTVCKGSLTLGSGCMKCERCCDELRKENDRLEGILSYKDCQFAFMKGEASLLRDRFAEMSRDFEVKYQEYYKQAHSYELEERMKLKEENQRLRTIIRDAENCLACLPIADSFEVYENTMKILKEANNSD